jgi:copper chaperone CopZ
MFRRRFLQLVALSGTGALATLDAIGVVSDRSATYLVEGFSCPTCAVGLDTMLGKQNGIVSSKSTYPEGRVTVRYKSDLIAETAVRAFITEMGFTVKAASNS